MHSAAHVSKFEGQKSTKGSRFCLPLFALTCLALTWPLLFGGYTFEIQFDLNSHSNWQTPEIKFLKQAIDHQQAILEERALSSHSAESEVKWHGSVPQGRKERGEKQGGGSKGLHGHGTECHADSVGGFNGRQLSEQPQKEANAGQGMCQVDDLSCRRGGQERLRVFVYELPANFTTEFYKHPSAVKGAHSAEWWIYQAIMSPRPDGTSSVVRVLDRTQADVFFVPFMGSQAFLCADSAQYTLPDHGEVCGQLRGKNHQLADELQSWLEQQEPWQRSGGIDHVIMLVHPLALDRKRTIFRQALFLLTDFAQTWSTEVSLAKDVIVPYMHVVESLPAGMAAESVSPTYLRNLTTLLFFSGNLQRLGMGAVRRQLAELLADAPDVVIRSANEGNVVPDSLLESTAEEMRRAKFCLHPAGDTPSSSRIYDAIVNLCIPVIVSDDIELPFEDLIDYSGFSLFVKEREAVQPGALLQRLRSVPDVTVLQMRQRLLQVRHYFEYTDSGGAVNMIWREVGGRVPSIRLRIARKRREATREQPATLDTLTPERDFHLAGNWSGGT